MASESINKIRLPALASKLKGMRQEVRTAIENVCSNAEQIDHLVIAINEASMNVIQHAYGDQEDGFIELEIYRENKQLIFRIIDFASSIDTSQVKPSNINDLRAGGLGVRIIQEVMDEMNFIKTSNGMGNILEMKVRLNPATEKH